jgi:hypothetical protein
VLNLHLHVQTNFAYGSTPYLTWRRVMQSPRVAAALAAAITAQPLPLHGDAKRRASDAGVAPGQGSGEGDSREGAGHGEAGAGAAGECLGEHLKQGEAGAGLGEYLVLGSSVGWMVLFAAATYGVRSRSARAQRPDRAARRAPPFDRR